MKNIIRTQIQSTNDKKKYNQGCPSIIKIEKKTINSIKKNNSVIFLYFNIKLYLLSLNLCVYYLFNYNYSNNPIVSISII